MALRLITDHIADCTLARNETRNAIRDVRSLLIAFIGAVGMVVVTFAGYTYTQQQSLAQQLAVARSENAAAVREIPAKTAAAVQAKLPPNE